nr:MAG TPA_asm: hypothetical protein [Caudoviricetes sp.]
MQRCVLFLYSYCKSENKCLTVIILYNILNV